MPAIESQSEVGRRHPGRRLDGFDEEPQGFGGVEVGSGPVAGGSEGTDARNRGMAGCFHLGRRPLERADDVADVVEALAAFFEPVGVDARAVERFDQLVLR